MPVKFDAAVAELMRELFRMGDMAERMVQTVLRSLKENNPKLLEWVLKTEKEMDGLQLRIDDLTVELIGIYTPVASDLRLLLMVPRITGALERMGDQSEKICNHVADFLSRERQAPVDLTTLAQLVCEMVGKCLSAFAARSAEGALEVLRMDLQVDGARNTIMDGLLAYMEEDATRVREGLHLMTIARAFERIGDQAVDVAEATIYAATGKDVRHLHLERKPTSEVKPLLFGRESQQAPPP
ncbi:MAG: phosphate signaling complex protein PhoU [Kiritimatiellae bacterium]|nr:phosphate signaling complex protein PhoU [Kiritimatiellia bacterium]